MATIIKKGHLTAHVMDGLDRESDGNTFTVRETGFSSTSQKTAINNAFAWLGKQWKRHMRKVNRFKRTVELAITPHEDVKKERVIRKRRKAVVHKLNKDIRELRKLARAPKKRIVFTVQDEANRVEAEEKLAKLVKRKQLKPLVPRKRVKRKRTKKAVLPIEEQMVSRLVRKRQLTPIVVTTIKPKRTRRN